MMLILNHLTTVALILTKIKETTYVTLLTNDINFEFIWVLNSANFATFHNNSILREKLISYVLIISQIKC